MSNGPEDIKLPIRLIPNRRSALGAALVIPLVGIFVLWGFAADMLETWQRTDLIYAFTAEPLATLGFGIGIVCVLWVEIAFILRALPNSPFFYFDIARSGVTHRDLFKIKTIGWEKIGRVNLIMRMQRSGKSNRKHWWILIEPADGDEDPDLKRRINRALLAYDTNDLAPPFGTSEAAANELMVLLKRLAKDSQAGQKELSAHVGPALRGIVVPMSGLPVRSSTQQAVAKLRRSSGSVIER